MSERYSLARVTAPSLLPVTLGEARQHLAITDAAHDAELEALLEAAVGYLDGKDGILGRCLVTQEWEARYDCWPRSGVFRLPLPPLQSVTWVKYVDQAGALQTWDPTSYQTDAASEPGRVALAWGKHFPGLRGGDLGAVQVRFVAGYGTPAKVPRAIKLDLLKLVARAFEDKTSVETAALDLAFSHRVWAF
jgi:uncharacterized phiE125 gp8 family phage protein